MLNRRTAVVLPFAIFVLLAGQAGASPPAITSAASRMLQGGHAFEVALPLSGASGVECRSVASGLTVIVRFNQAVTSGSASVTSGKASIAGAEFAGKAMTIKLVGVADAQEITLSLNKIAGGGQALNTTLKLRVLGGDVTGDGKVDDADATAAEKKPGIVDSSNFRADINASGTVRASDITLIKANLGKSVGVAGVNAPPVVNPIADQKLVSGQTPPGIGIAVKDTDTPASKVAVTVTSDNPALVPAENVMVSGDGASRVLTINPAAGKSGDAQMTVTASDGLSLSSTRFSVHVTLPPTLYTANMRPATTGPLLGSGQATLFLSGDETQATVRVDYSNLTGNKTGAQIRGPASAAQTAGVLIDLNTLTPNQDGSYTWVIAPANGLSVAGIVSAIKTGQTYIKLDTAANPNGEIRSQFLLNSALTFSPPGPAPAIPSGAPTQNDAGRFLIQATFGPSLQDIALLQAMGFDAWLAQQFSLPPSYTITSLKLRQGLGEGLFDDQFSEAWWGVATTAPDQLRQRVAFALSQILVISQNDPDLTDRPIAVADYYDMLLADAFGNFRQILEDVTLHPSMGNYLDMRGNRAQYLNGSGQIIIPNENYAREVLQLFSVGLNKIWPDGSQKLDDVTAQAVPTYDQDVIVGFARVFTGWNYHQAAQSTSPTRDDLLPMSLITAYHETGTKLLLDGVTLPANQGGQKDLADAMNLIFKHPNTAPFICRQLIQRLVTDNPSPGYVYRVSQVFADNGQGVRGDMKAVIRAILLDYEARSTAVISQPGYGKIREPILRLSHSIRALHPVSASGYFKIPNTETQLTQTAMRAPTVFNFFLPDYVYPGNLTTAGLFAPEMQVTYETTTINYSNTMYNNTVGNLTGGDLKYDLSTEQALVSGNDCTALVDRLSTVLMAGGMSSGMRTTLINYLNSTTNITSGDTLTRARAAVHLITTSPEFCTQK